MIGTGQAPTRAAVLELMNEQAVVNEAYIFLDEKRMLLASELLRQLKIYTQLAEELKLLHGQAVEAMKISLMLHGLDELQVYPPLTFDNISFNQHETNFMGVALVETELAEDNGAAGVKHLDTMGKVDQCANAFREMLINHGKLSGVSGNLYRLMDEFKITERRARALENVILPEIKQALREMSSHLEELDLEDAVRVRMLSAVREL